MLVQTGGRARDPRLRTRRNTLLQAGCGRRWIGFHDLCSLHFLPCANTIGERCSKMPKCDVMLECHNR